MRALGGAGQGVARVRDLPRVLERGAEVLSRCRWGESDVERRRSELGERSPREGPGLRRREARVLLSRSHAARQQRPGFRLLSLELARALRTSWSGTSAGEKGRRGAQPSKRAVVALSLYISRLLDAVVPHIACESTFARRRGRRSSALRWNEARAVRTTSSGRVLDVVEPAAAAGPRRATHRICMVAVRESSVSRATVSVETEAGRDAPA